MDDIIIKQLIEESISSANEVASGCNDKHSGKRVRFFDGIEKTRKKLIISDNCKSGMCCIDGQRFHPFTSRNWIGDFPASFFITNDHTGICGARAINKSIEATKWTTVK